MSTQLTPAEVVSHLEAVTAFGVNSLVISAFERRFTSHTPAYANHDGVEPFSNLNDWTTHNSAFFNHLRWILQKCEEYGVLVLLAPAYIGYGGGVEGWMSYMRSNGVANLTAYGSFLGSLIAGCPNVLIVNACDYNAPDTGSPSDQDLILAVADGIKATAPDILHTLHWTRYTSSSEHGEAKLDGLKQLDSTYSSGLNAVDDTLSDRARSAGVRPYYFFEGNYLGENSTTRLLQRVQMYAPMMCGAAGFIVGRRLVWFFGRVGDGNPGHAFGAGPPTGDWDALSTQQPLPDLSIAKAHFESFSWDLLQPITKTGSGASHSISATFPDNSEMHCYFTADVATTLDLSLIDSGGAVEAYWTDPTTGVVTPDPSNPYLGVATVFNTPGANADGDTDWALRVVKAAASAIFPLSVQGGDRKYFQTATGVPWLGMSELVGPLSVASKADVTALIASRQGRIDMFLNATTEHKFATGSPAWVNADGHAPFYDVNDWTTTVPEYWAHIVWVAEQCRDAGIVLALAVGYLGYDGGAQDEGWMSEMRANGVANLYAHGQFLGTLLGHLENIVIVHGGDRTPSTTGAPSDRDLVWALWDGVRNTGPSTWHHTTHWSSPNSSTDQNLALMELDGRLDLDGVYFNNPGAGKHGLWQYVLAAWQAHDISVRPVMALETWFEQHLSTAAAPQPADMRSQIYHSFLSGGIACLLANGPVWWLGEAGDANPAWSFWSGGAQVNWQDALSSPGIAGQDVARTLLGLVEWEALIPDVGNVYITDDFARPVPDEGESAVTAALPDGSVVVSYFTTHTLSRDFDLSAMGGSGGVVVTWWDPTNGDSTPDPSSPYPASASTPISPPGPNDDGDGDWLMIAEREQ